MKRSKPPTPRPRRAKGAKPATGRRPGIIFNALPTHRDIQVQLTQRGEPVMIFPGRTVLFDDMKSYLARLSRPFWHPGSEGQTLRNFDWIVNMLADPDHYDQALRFLDRNFAANPLPIFNRPAEVLKTRRDLVTHHLSGIESLICPACLRFSPTSPQCFRETFEKGEFAYPVLIRPAGSHTGHDLLKIDTAEDWDKIHQIPWGGRTLYMTQWIDFRSDKGEWRKLRLSITSESVRLRHILYGDSWLIHSAHRDTDIVNRELDILLNADDWAALQTLGQNIRSRLKLDFFGVDIGWKSDSAFVLFEANPSMSILSYHNMPTLRREDYTANLQRIEQDVWRALERVTKIKRTGKIGK